MLTFTFAVHPLILTPSNRPLALFVSTTVLVFARPSKTSQIQKTMQTSHCLGVT